LRTWKPDEDLGLAVNPLGVESQMQAGKDVVERRGIGVRDL
jgi:hypothetical protein